MNALKTSFRKILYYPSAIVGLLVVFLLVATAVYAMVSIPYDEAIRLWRGGEEVWYQNPKFAPPSWINFFSSKKYAESFSVRTTDGSLVKEVTPGAEGTATLSASYAFNFTYDYYPQDLILYFTSNFVEKQPFVSVEWLTPDGRKIRLTNLALTQKQAYRFSQDDKLKNRLRTEDIIPFLFSDPETGAPVKGQYQLLITGATFEPDSNVDIEFVFHGQVYGLAGTDQSRRDLVIPLLWGAPVALAFGLIASLGTSVLTMIIAALGTWYGGWIDELIQRITEINLVLPFLSILIMIGTFYSRSIWVILGATILLSIFTGAIKSYRSIFIQVKESMYIEAARAYGASSPRIIFLYLIPRMIPLLIPGLVSAVPAFVFLEASLAVLGLGDPVLPTWGKIIQDANSNGALYRGYYYWILEPATLLMITGLGFAMLGFALDRIFNPKLRDI
ncbi:MAG: ABC transporter permease [Anaerolineales bacterium]|nr:ABC transporter permease [Anaerolineae bacterium]PWB77342.1 MAG: ABC transporter permease [Anaerolineales bacterium]